MAGKKNIGLGMAAIAAGAGVAAVAAKTHKKAEKKEIRKKEAERRQEYRNTEIGKNEKNSKGIYYSNGNYEAFARPRKPEGVDDKNAYIVAAWLHLQPHVSWSGTVRCRVPIFTFWKQWI